MAQFKLKNWKGDKIKAEAKRAVGRALYKGASHILNESTRIAPLDEGPLTQTAGIDVDETGGKASIYYVQPYAAKLHESQSIQIRRGRQNKYLEKPMISETEAIREIFAEEVKKSLRG